MHQPLLNRLRATMACAGVIMLISACAGAASDDLEARVETLENVTIESLKTQIQSISGSLGEYKSTQDQLAGYMTELQAKIGQLDGQGYADLKSQVDGLKNRADAFDTALANLEAYVNQKGADLQQWVKDYYASQEKFNELKGTVTGISGSLTEIVSRLNGLDQTTAGIAQDLKDKTDKLTTDLTACRTDIDRILGTLEELGNSIDVLERDVAAIISAVQSVVVVPDYTDGSVKMTDGAENILRFEVYPLSAAQKLVDIGVSAFSLDFVETETKSSIFTNIPITGVSFDGEVVSVTADCSNLSGKVVKGQQSVNARLRISDGTITRSSEYFLLSPKQRSRIITGDPVEVDERSAVIEAWNYFSSPGDEQGNVYSPNYGIIYSKYLLTFLESSNTYSTTIDEEHKFETTITDLDANTVYYYQAFAIHEGVRYCGEVKSFKTKAVSAEVSTLDATEIALFKATLNGVLTIDSQKDFTKSVYFIVGTDSSLEGLKSNGEKYWASLRDDGTFYRNVTDLFDYTNYYYVACASVQGMEFYGNVKSFSTGVQSNGVVDMGLSVKWKACNLGASKVYEKGAFYAWGEIEPKDDYRWSYYKWANGAKDKLTKYCPSDKTEYWGKDGTPDDKILLDAEDDIAVQTLGDKWRIPTVDEWFDLLFNSKQEKYESSDGSIRGLLVTSLLNGNFLFFPVTGVNNKKNNVLSGNGYYWTSSIDPEYPYTAVFVTFDGLNKGDSEPYRYNGLVIRPVYDDSSQ